MARLDLVFRNSLKTKSSYGLLLCILCFVIFILYFIPLKDNLVLNSPELINEKPHHIHNHTLCVLVPYRDAFEELKEFIPHISKFLDRQSINFHIAVIDHVSDGNRFNKGSLLNAGFKLVSKMYPNCDYIALHDIDLLPLNDQLSYAYPGDDEVFHVANPDYHPLGYMYIQDLYIGGIAILSNQLFIRVNGFGNNFWGWGFEDQNFSLRLKKNNIVVNRPTNLSTDRSNTFKHIHRSSRKRDILKCANQISAAYADPDFITGINDVNYEISSVHSFTIDGFPFSLFGVTLPCNFIVTPWCKPFCLGDADEQKNG